MLKIDETEIVTWVEGLTPDVSALGFSSLPNPVREAGKVVEAGRT